VGHVKNLIGWISAYVIPTHVFDVIQFSEIEADLYLLNPRGRILAVVSHSFSVDSHALLMTFECGRHVYVCVCVFATTIW